MSEVLNTLTAARAIIEGGWTQHDLTDGRGNYCLKAALGLASGAYVEIDGSVTLPRLDYSTATADEMRAQAESLRSELVTADVVRHMLPSGFECIPLFNDHPRTTKVEVLAVLDEAIAWQSATARAVMSA
jgi:hypothetical protein